MITEKGDVTTSFLLIQRARKSDSGKYTCAPSNANPVTVNVHILNGMYVVIRILRARRSAWDAFHSVYDLCIFEGNNVVVPNNLQRLNPQTGEHPAAMQRGGRLLLSHPLAVPVLALIPFLLDRWMGLRLR